MRKPTTKVAYLCGLLLLGGGFAGSLACVLWLNSSPPGTDGSGFGQPRQIVHLALTGFVIIVTVLIGVALIVFALVGWIDNDNDND